MLQREKRVSELTVDTYAEHLVRAGEHISTRQFGQLGSHRLGQADVLKFLRHVVVVAAFAGIVLVVGPEVGNVEVEILCQLNARTETERPGAGNETDVFHVVVRQAILRALHTTTNLDALVHIPFDTGQVFVRTGRKQLLLVISHIGLLVEEVVVAHRSTERRQ